VSAQVYNRIVGANVPLGTTGTISCLSALKSVHLLGRNWKKYLLDEFPSSGEATPQNANQRIVLPYNPAKLDLR